MYDDLTLNGMNIDQLKSFLDQRQKRERTFASVSLRSLGTSASVQVQVHSDLISMMGWTDK